MSNEFFDLMQKNNDRIVDLVGSLASVCVWAEMLRDSAKSGASTDWELGKLMDAVKEARKVMERREA